MADREFKPYRPGPGEPKTLEELHRFTVRELRRIASTFATIDLTIEPGSIPVDHDSLQGITPNNHHDQQHFLYGNDHPDVETGVAPQFDHSLVFNNANKWVAGYRTKWIEPYSLGPEYQPMNMVLDGAWTMIANKKTDDSAAPIPEGAPVQVYPTDPVWETASHTGHVYSVLELTTPADGLYSLEALRVWVQNVTADDHYQVLTQNTDGVFTELLSFDGDLLSAAGWLDIPWQESFLTPGGIGRAWLHQWNSASATSQTFPWVRLANTNSDIDPGPGNWSTRNSNTTLRVNNLDDNGVDRSAVISDLALIGTVIRLEQADTSTKWIEYLVNSLTDQGTWVQYGVSVAGEGPGGEPDVAAVCDITYQVPVLASTTYVSLTGHLAQFPSLQSYLTLDDPALVTPSQNGVGIDATFQPYYISPDWDVVAYSGSVGGGGGGGDLTDHSLNFHSDVNASPSNNQALVWNNTAAEWQAGGPYLPLAGGTLTGGLIIDFNNINSLVLNKTTDTDYQGLQFATGGKGAWLLHTVNDGSNDLFMQSQNYDNGGDFKASIVRFFHADGSIRFYNNVGITGDLALPHDALQSGTSRFALKQVDAVNPGAVFRSSGSDNYGVYIFAQFSENMATIGSMDPATGATNARARIRFNDFGYGLAFDTGNAGSVEQLNITKLGEFIFASGSLIKNQKQVCVAHGGVIGSSGFAKGTGFGFTVSGGGGVYTINLSTSLTATNNAHVDIQIENAGPGFATYQVVNVSQITVRTYLPAGLTALDFSFEIYDRGL